MDDLVRLDLQYGVQEAFGVTTPRDRIGKFIRERLSSAFREGQNEPPQMTPEEQQLFHVFQHQRELFRYRLMDELTYDLLRLIDQGADLEDPPTHILSDEYQDFTPGELRLLQRFHERFGVVVDACGDDRQSIFRFRAADPLALHRFPNAYAVEEVDYLWRSSRCPQSVCDLANSMAEALPHLEGLERPPLEPWEGREDLGVVEIAVASTPQIEARWITRRCAQFRDEGAADGDIIVVAAGYVADVLAGLEREAEAGDGAPSFYDARVGNPYAGDLAIQLLAAGMRLLMRQDDQMAWRRLVAETPGIGEMRLKRILNAGAGTYLQGLREVAETDAICARPVAAGDALLAHFAEREEFEAPEVVELIAERLGIGNLSTELLEEFVGEQPPVSAHEWFERIIEGSDESQRAPTDLAAAIPVYTIFGAKGLQAPIVFVANAMTDCFTQGGEVDDGLRRAYVSVTRAQRRLLVSAPLYLRGSTLAHKVDARSPASVTWASLWVAPPERGDGLSR